MHVVNWNKGSFTNYVGWLSWSAYCNVVDRPYLLKVPKHLKFVKLELSKSFSALKYDANSLKIIFFQEYYVWQITFNLECAQFLWLFTKKLQIPKEMCIGKNGTLWSGMNGWRSALDSYQFIQVVVWCASILQEALYIILSLHFSQCAGWEHNKKPRRDSFQLQILQFCSQSEILSTLMELSAAHSVRQSVSTSVHF